MTENKLAPTALAHLKAEHNVVIFFSTDTKGFLALYRDDIGTEDYIDIYDTESLDAEETDSIYCNTCGIDLTDPEGMVP